MTVRSLRAATLLALLAGCASARVGGARANEAAAVRAARAAQNQAIAAGDAEAVARYWTDDVTIRRGLGQPVTGARDARRLFEPSGPRDSALVYRRDPDEVTVSSTWPLAFESGRWSGRRGGEGPALVGGRYSAQWVRRDGRWLIRSEVFVALTCAGTGCASAAAP